MNTEAFADYLKGSIPGIILLGAIGSILAVGILWLIRKLLTAIWSAFRKVMPMAAASVRNRFLKYGLALATRCGLRMGRAKKRGIQSVVSLLLYHAVSCIVCLMIATISCFILYARLRLQDEVALTRPVLITSTVAVLFFGLALLHFFPIWIEVFLVTDKGDAILTDRKKTGTPPNQALQPTTTVVTSPAAQEPRQP